MMPSASVNDHFPIIGCKGTDTGREAGMVVGTGGRRSEEEFIGAVLVGTISVTLGGTVVTGIVDCVVVWGAEAHPAKHTVRIMKDIIHPDITIQRNFSSLPAIPIE